ncbi:MAG: efflux RND transporter periplasmic adaptor subunit [Nitrospirae bacterium]|nr:efflux RND transporter periplasmic adaptor subunit [Nitrospirota bacterium]
MNKISIVLIPPVLLIILAAFIPGCEKKVPPKVEEAPRITTYKVASKLVRSYVEATGTIQADTIGGAKILSPLPGSVETIFVKNGDTVSKGKPLLAIRSTDVSDTYSAYLSSSSQLRQTERAYRLNKELLSVGAITKNDFLNSESTYEQAKALSEGLKRKLAAYGASSSASSLKDFQDRLVIKAPVDGRVADILAHIGDRFDTSTPLMTIANPDRIMVVANIYDTDIPRIKKDKEVSFSTDVFPSKTFMGVISNISDVEDVDTKTIKTYIKITGEKGVFKQNMFLKIKILDGEITVPEIPKTAMIYKDGKFYVNLKRGNAFALKEIKPVRDVSEKIMAVEGLNEGDEVAYSAIDLEKP